MYNLSFLDGLFKGQNTCSDEIRRCVCFRETLLYTQRLSALFDTAVYREQSARTMMRCRRNGCAQIGRIYSNNVGELLA